MLNALNDQQPHSEWFVLGAGALGCLWAAMLVQCGSKVTVIVRDANPQHRRTVQLRYSGFQPRAHTSRNDSSGLSSNPSLSTYAIDKATALALASEDAKIANLLVTTKSYDALEAIDTVLPLLETGAKVLTLCNGYGLHQPIAELLRSQQRDIDLHVGVSSDGALLRGPLDVVHTGVGTTKIGRFGGQSVTRYLPAALPLAVEYVSDVETSILHKFFINCAINPLTALHDCTNGELLIDPDLYQEFQLLCRELQNIYQAVVQHLNRRHPAECDTGFDVLLQATQVATTTAANHSSMLQDYRKRRKLELQFLNHEAIVQAKRFSIACPINEHLVSQLQQEPG